MKTVEIIAVGNEVTTGDIVNTNTVFISKKLTEAGFDVAYQSVVGDYPEKIIDLLNIAKTRSDIIIFTGGLGPTKDDLTKETVCMACSKELVENSQSLNRIKAYFDAKNVTMTENNIKQALFPVDAEIFVNTKGTADGCAIEHEGKIFICLPGPPSENRPMFELSVLPYLMQKNDGCFACETLKVFGMGEAQLTHKYSEYFEMDDPTVATYVNGGVVRIKITSNIGTREECRQKCKSVAESLKSQLGTLVFGEGEDELAQVVVNLLAENNLKISTAESCTAGLISKMITDVSGASNVFEYGISAYANRIKTKFLDVPEDLIEKYGVVSEPVAEAMAKGVAQKGDADIGVGITGIAGPGGGTPQKPVGTVCISVFCNNKFFTKTVRASGAREKVRHFSAMTALNMVRLSVMQEF